MKDVFTRFDLDLGESVNWYVQGSWAQSETASDWIQWVVSPSAGRPNSIFSNNPYLSANTQGLLGAGIACALGGHGWRCLPAVPAISPQTGSTPPPPPLGAGNVPLSACRPISGTWSMVSPPMAPEPAVPHIRRPEAVECRNRRHRQVRRGLDWDVYYNHGVSDLTVTNPEQHRQREIPRLAGCRAGRRHHQVLGQHADGVRRPLPGLRSDQHHRSEWTVGGVV